jgi:hypothetical protein
MKKLLFMAVVVILTVGPALTSCDLQDFPSML